MEEDFNIVFDENQDTINDSNSCLKRTRVILHFDIDCFYAQVEIIKDPSLSSKPVGIKQKNIVVTCNYIAREKGKGMQSSYSFLQLLREKFPNLFNYND